MVFRAREKPHPEPPAAASDESDLASPWGEVGCGLSDEELRETAYEVLVGSCRASGGKPLTFVSGSERGARGSDKPPSPALQRSLTSTAASRVKSALGLRSGCAPPSGKSLSRRGGSGGSSSLSRLKRPVTIGELLRVQMRVSEQTDSRIRRGLLRIASTQLGRSIESIVLPLELLQQFKSSDFLDNEEYKAWQARHLKVLEAGLLVHPSYPVEKSNPGSQQLGQIIRGALEKPVDTGKSSETMQALRTAVTSLAFRSVDGFGAETCHWADGYPLNLRLYQMLLEACFDQDEGTSVIEEVDEVVELLKKTWPIFGLNQMLHNLCFSWVFFKRYVSAGQVENDLLSAASAHLTEVLKDTHATKEPSCAKILNSTFNSITSWTERRLLAYHDTFQKENLESMEGIVSLCVSATKLLVEDVSSEHRRRRKEEVDVARNKIDSYIRSSLRTAFAQTMEKTILTRRSSKIQSTSTPRLAILAEVTCELANTEKNYYSPILKRWHPFASGVAMATLHACYRSELKQFMSGLKELTPETVHVLKAADKLEKDLVQIAVEDSVDSEDGGKAIIREMPPYEAESAILDLTKAWIKLRVDTLKEYIDKNVVHEVWLPHANRNNTAPSATEALQVVDETINTFFELPIPMHEALLVDLVSGLDKSIQHYISKAISGYGNRSIFMPTLPLLTRSTTGSKFPAVFKKKEKILNSRSRTSQVGSINGRDLVEVPQLCVRLNTMYHIRVQLDLLEKKIVNCTRNTERSHGDALNGMGCKFELSLSDCQEGSQQLCEAISYKLIFHELGHVLWDGLYVGDVASSRIEPFRSQLDSQIEMLFSNVTERMHTHLVKAIMKASFEGFLLVILAGGPSRNFTRQDARVIEDDFNILKSVYVCGGDGLPEEIVEKAASTVRTVLPLLHADTDSLIERYRRLTLEMFGPAAKSKLPLPPTTGKWSNTDPNTILRILCYRNDEVASKFLKRVYDLPKKL